MILIFGKKHDAKATTPACRAAPNTQAAHPADNFHVFCERTCTQNLWRFNTIDWMLGPYSTLSDKTIQSQAVKKCKHLS
jgi:hypothetical protein